MEENGKGLGSVRNEANPDGPASIGSGLITIPGHFLSRGQQPQESSGKGAFTNNQDNSAGRPKRLGSLSYLSWTSASGCRWSSAGAKNNRPQGSD